MTKKFNNAVIVRIDKGEEILESLYAVCKKYNITLGSVSGIGATNKAKVGLFEVETKEYHATELTGNYEIAPLTGNISTMNGETYIHVHINLSDNTYKSFGGHLNYAVVSATCECVIHIIDGECDREFSEEIGLNLFVD